MAYLLVHFPGGISDIFKIAHSVVMLVSVLVVGNQSIWSITKKCLCNKNMDWIRGVFPVFTECHMLVYRGSAWLEAFGHSNAVALQRTYFSSITYFVHAFVT
jgi:hypothetical protein